MTLGVLTESKKYLQKEPCVICFGAILKSVLDGELLQEVLATCLEKTSLLAGTEQITSLLSSEPIS